MVKQQISLLIQRQRPFGRLIPRKIHTLAIENIRPIIRIAHRWPGPIHLPERIIFDHEFVLFLKGKGKLTLAKETFPYGPHDLFFLPPFVSHSITEDEVRRTEHIAVHFDLAPRFPSFARHPDRRPPYEVRFAHGMQLPRRVTLFPDDEIERFFLALLRGWEGKTPLGNLDAEACLLRILVALFQKKPSPTVNLPSSPGSSRLKHARLERALSFVREHFAEDLSVTDLARSSGLSPSRFSRLFREWTAYSPAEYLRRLRIEQARKFLGNIGLSIKEIAARTGFKDPYHFSKVFHELDGLSPSHYREALLAGVAPVTEFDIT